MDVGMLGLFLLLVFAAIVAAFAVDFVKVNVAGTPST